MFNFCDQVPNSFKSLVWTCSLGVIIYFYNMLSLQLFERLCISLFPNWTGWRPLQATYLATDLQRLGRSCKPTLSFLKIFSKIFKISRKNFRIFLHFYFFIFFQNYKHYSKLILRPTFHCIYSQFLNPLLTIYKVFCKLLNIFAKIYSVFIKLQLKFGQIFILVYLKIFLQVSEVF